MPSKNRVFWNEQEKQTVIAAARALRGKTPGMNLEDVALKAQASLPKNRRRPMNGKLVSWVSKSIRGAATSAAAAPSGSSRGSQGRGRAAPAEAPSSASSPMAQAVIDAGAAILSGIIMHPSVRGAILRAFSGQQASQGRAGK